MTEEKTDNLSLWNALKTPPEGATKPISGGRLSGKTDINPQWRLEAMTRQFGPCGVDWYYTIKRLWTVEAGVNSEVAAFAEVDVHVKIGGEWANPIPGIGGNMFVEQEKGGPHVSDECFKMAVTDALSVAFKALGVAADVYMGKFDSKYDKGGGKAGGGRRRQPKDEGLGECPKCGTFMRKVVLKDGSGRWFMGCQAYPDCKYTKWPDKKEPQAASAAANGAQAPPPGPRPVEAVPPTQGAMEMCPACGKHAANLSGYCPNEHGAAAASQRLTAQDEAPPEWRPQCCGRSMMPRAGLDGGAPFWQCPRCKKKKVMSEDERGRVGL